MSPRGWGRRGSGARRHLGLPNGKRGAAAPSFRALRRGTGNLPRRPYASSFNHDLSGTDVAIDSSLHAGDSGRVPHIPRNSTPPLAFWTPPDATPAGRDRMIISETGWARIRLRRRPPAPSFPGRREARKHRQMSNAQDRTPARRHA